jgi:molybdopterin/thiamine biosynthesis adenylyltransferase
MIEGAVERLERSVGRRNLARLQASKVAVMGAGLLGGMSTYHLGLLGVGMVVVDCGKVEPENLGNQGFFVDQLGAWKSQARAQQVAKLNPDCAVSAVSRPVEALGLAELDGVDLLVGGLDGRAARVRVNEISQRLSIPFVDAAVDGSGEQLLGTVTVYDPRSPEGACYLCRYRAEDLATIAREGRGPGCPSWRGRGLPDTPPTLVAPFFGGVVGGHLSLLAVRVMLGHPGEFANTQLLIDCNGTPRVRAVSLTRRRNCLVDHGPLELLPSPGDGTVGGLLERAAHDLGKPSETLILHNRPLVVGEECRACGKTTELLCLAEVHDDEGLRCACGGPAPLVLTDRLSREQAQRIAARKWADLGLPPSDVVTAAAGSKQAHYLVNQPSGSPSPQAAKAGSPPS